MKVQGEGFDVAVTPVVTNGAYSAGDIVGGLLEFDVSERPGVLVLVQEIQVALKANVQPNMRLVLLNADPTVTTKTDNAVYSLAQADVFKARKTITLSGWVNHGTPKTLNLGGLALPIQLLPGSDKLYGLLIDDTGVTLTSTSDVQVTLMGLR